MALVTTLMATILMLALGAGVTLATLTETAIAANHRDGIQTLYAAEAGIDLAVDRLRTTADWRSITVSGRLADLLAVDGVDGRIDVVVTISADPADATVLLVQSSATGPGGNRRSVQAIIRRMPADADGVHAIDTLAWY